MSSLPKLIIKNDYRVISFGPSKPVLRFIALHPDAALPEAKGADALALDLRATDDTYIAPGRSRLVNFGIVLSPESRQYTAGQQLSLRSGFASSSGCIMTNGVGLIERSFTGFTGPANRLYGIAAYLHNVSDVECSIEEAERVAQLLVWGADGRVMLPGRDFTVEWDTSYYTGGASFLRQDEWDALLKPGGRGGFGSTGSK